MSNEQKNTETNAAVVSEPTSTSTVPAQPKVEQPSIKVEQPSTKVDQPSTKVVQPSTNEGTNDVFKILSVMIPIVAFLIGQIWQYVRYNDTHDVAIMSQIFKDIPGWCLWSVSCLTIACTIFIICGSYQMADADRSVYSVFYLLMTSIGLIACPFLFSIVSFPFTVDLLLKNCNGCISETILSFLKSAFCALTITPLYLYLLFQTEISGSFWIYIGIVILLLIFLMCTKHCYPVLNVGAAFIMGQYLQWARYLSTGEAFIISDLENGPLIERTTSRLAISSVIALVATILLCVILLKEDNYDLMPSTPCTALFSTIILIAAPGAFSLILLLAGILALTVYGVKGSVEAMSYTAFFGTAIELFLFLFVISVRNLM